MGLSVVYCPKCGKGFFQRNALAASAMWARHFAVAHTRRRAS